jgi:DNA helicase HerA-like ATPase
MFGKKRIPYGERVGVLVGRGNEPNTLRAAVAFSESEKAPILGEFLVVEESELRKRRLLCRVDDITYGDFHTTQDERERTLVEKYIRDISGHERPFSEEEKSMLFFQHYTLRVLGEFRVDEDTNEERIATDYRYLPELTAILRYPRQEELKTLTAAGLPHLREEDETNVHLPAVGHLSFGESEVQDVLVRFDVSRFAAKRTAIFARTGYGKSNLAKFVVALAGITAPDSGMLIMDLEGEYAFTTSKEDGSKVYGLADIPHLRSRLTVFTNRKVLSSGGVQVYGLMNFREMSPYDIRNLIPPSPEGEERATIQDFAVILKAVKEEWDQLLNIVETSPENWEERVRQIDTLADKAYQNKKIASNQRNLLVRTIRHLLPLHNPKGTNVFEEIQRSLKNRRIVILDLSLVPLQFANQIAAVALERIFSYNQYHITTQQSTIPVIAVFEEAQNVLNKKAVESGDSIFVRWAKEGRKYNLGLIYITQQPGAIAEEIVSQTDNFFVMHLLSKGDVDALVHANRHYGGVIAHFLGTETVIGNAYIYSAPYQPFVFPAHIWEFKPEVFTELFGDPPIKSGDYRQQPQQPKLL